MLNFQYYTPTRVIFGKDSEQEVGSLLKQYHCKKVLVHYGGQSAVKSGLLDRIYTSLREASIDYVSLGGVVPNPRISKAREGIELCKQENVDFILAVGGGSVIDSAKAIGYGVACGGDVWDFYDKKRTPTDCLPIGCVLTIAAAGSEMSNSSVLTNEEGWLKRGCKSEICRCKFAIMNPELTYSLPQYQTFSGCVDIMMHTLERYFSNHQSMELTDRLCESLLKTVINNALLLLKEPTNYEARAEIMWAGSLSHNGLMGCGTDGGDWSCHQLEHELGGMFDVAHGAGLAAVWGSWARYVMPEHEARFAQLGYEVFQLPVTEDLRADALLTITTMEAFFQKIGMPTSISDMGIKLTDEQIETLAYKCSFEEQRTIGTLKKLTSNDMSKIYQMAR